MKTALRVLCIVGLAVLVMSCPTPQLAQIAETGTASVSSGTSAVATPRIMNDAARGQAVYVDEAGTAVDIVSQEPDGTTIASTEAVGMAVMPVSGSGTASKGMSRGTSGSSGSGDQMRAIVVGKRSDGRGGVWVVLRDGTVLPAGDSSGSRNGSGLPECDDHDTTMHGWMGWTYTVTGISDDGLVIIGNAVNAKGWHHGGVTIDPNTSVGVYWKVSKIGHRPFIFVSAAKVIGTLDSSKVPQKKGHGGWHHHAWKWLDNLKLFLLGAYTAYLTEADSVIRGTTGSDYVVTGVDQDGNDATATIDASGSIVIAPVTTNAQPDLTVSAIQAPTAATKTTDTWTLGSTVRNAGTGDAGSFTILYQLSTKSTLDSTATTIGSSVVTGLAAGASYTDTVSTSYSIAEGGTHWIFVTVDAAATVTESNEANNTASASVPVIYPEVVIDTYLPVSGSPASVNTFVTLFGPAGDTTIDTPDLWNNDKPPYTTETGALAENGAAGRYGRIDDTDGLAPGTYYVRVRTVASYQQGGYGIRVLTRAPDNPSGSTWSWYFTATNPTDANPAGGSYEPDDSPTQGGVPSNPVTITVNGKLNRWLTPGDITSGTPGDVDWFKLILP